jgi:N-acyl-D-aspartate/D-glutamate deacylase
MRYDLVLQNGKLIDGTAAPWRRANIAIRDGRIAAISTQDLSGNADAAVDIGGRFVTPGFVNIHSHLDFAILGMPTMDSAVLQGITTELGGQCGQSIAPTDIADAAKIKDFYRNHWHGFDLHWDWATLGDFLDRLESEGVSLNFGMQVGHQTLRLIAMGFECRPATAAELERIQALLRAALRDGAFGMSCGIQWAPSFFCTTQELIELGKVVAESNGFVSFHMRSEGDMLLEAVAEVIEVGERAQVPVQISHLKAAGKRNFGKVQQALAQIAAARARGVDVLADTQPYGCLDRQYAAENMWMRSAIPPWFIAEAGGFKHFQERLADPAFRARIKQDVLEKKSANWRTHIVDCMLEDVGWDGLVLGSTDVPEFETYVGLSIQDIARQRNADPFDTYFDLLARERVAGSGVYFMMAPDDVRTVIKSEYAMPQVDAAPRHTHPRRYGAFAHYLQHYAKNASDLSLEEAVRKLTSMPAARMGLSDRGVARVGAWADLCVLNMDALEDRADFNRISVSPSGIDYVLVNGTTVVKDGRHTGARPGKVLRSSRSSGI